MFEYDIEGTEAHDIMLHEQGVIPAEALSEILNALEEIKQEWRDGKLEIGVEYGVNLNEVRELISKAVRDVDGVLQNKPIDVLFLEFGDPALILRIRWWIDSYEDTRRMFDRVNEAIYHTLNEAKIDMPPQMYDLRILNDPESNGPDNALNQPNNNAILD